MSREGDDRPLIRESQDSVAALRTLVAELNTHTALLRTEIAVLIEVIAQERARRESGQ